MFVSRFFRRLAVKLSLVQFLNSPLFKARETKLLGPCIILPNEDLGSLAELFRLDEDMDE